MPHKLGAHIDGMRTLEDLRGRCVVDPDTACWHLRTANGKRLPPGTPYVWVHGVGVISAKRAAWLLRNGEQPASEKRVYAVCKSPHDCVHTSHLRAWTVAEYGAFVRTTGRLRGDARRSVINRQSSAKAAKLTQELAHWARESEQSHAKAAHALGVSESLVAQIRRRQKWTLSAAPSVFEWRPV